MEITVEDNSIPLMELLWVREAWGLAVSGHFPPPLTDTPVQMDAATRAPDDITVWQQAWPQLWHDAVAHAAEGTDPALVETLSRPSLDHAERAALLHRLIGPTWHEHFGDDSLGHAFADWQNRHVQGLIDRMREHRRADEQPEHASLDSLVPAWRRGLYRIVTVPCEGTFTRTIGPHALLVTVPTRDDPARYRRALAEFAGA